jgi:hypothetical protein
MARKKKNEPPIRSRVINFRVTQELYEVIEKDASAARMSMSAHLFLGGRMRQYAIGGRCKDFCHLTAT